MDMSMSRKMNEEEDDLLADSDDSSSSDDEEPQKGRPKAESFFENKDEDSSDSDEESEGDMDVDEDELQIELTAVNDKLAAEPYSYDLYLEKIRILKALGDSNKLKSVREKMSQLYPLSPALWVDWIKDEQKYAATATDEEKDEFIKLMDRAVKDYASVEVWLEYINYCLSRMQDPNGVERCRDVFERALGSCGLHVSMGSLIWDTYRDFEAALLGTQMGSEDEQNTQEKKYTSLCKRQLSVPLLNMHNSYEAIKSKINMDANTEEAFKKAFERLGELETWEAKLVQASDEAQRVKIYKKYIENEIKAKSNPARIQCLYERTITDSPLDVSIWMEYIDYLYKHLKVPELALEVAERASRNCPWIISVWTKYMWVVETFIEEDEKAFNKMKTVFENAIVYCGTGDQAGTIWLKYLEFLKRKINFENPVEKQLVILRKTFTAAEQHLLQLVQEPNECISQINQFHARFEANLSNSMTKEAREIWKDLFSRGYGNTYRIWSQYIIQLITFHEEPNRIRNELSKAMTYVQDDKQAAADLWLNYERDYGNLTTITNAEEKISKELEKSINNNNTYADGFGEKNSYNNNNNRGRSSFQQNYDKPGGGNRNNEGRKRKFDEPINFVPAKKGKGTNDEVDGRRGGNQNDSNFKTPAIPKSKAAENDSKKSSKKLPAAPVKHDSSKDHRTVFVSNLTFKTNEETIKTFLEPCGPVEEVRLVRDFKGKSKGFGYIFFVNPESVQIALSKDREPLDGRPVFISKCDPDKANRPLQFKYAVALEKNKIFIKGLPFTMTEEDLNKKFQEFGVIKACRLVINNAGHSKGLAYIEYENAASASAAILKTDETIIDGKTISVAISNPPSKNRPPSQQSQFSEPTIQDPGLRRGRNVFVPRVVQIAPAGESSTSKPNAPKSNDDFRKLFMKK